MVNRYTHYKTYINDSNYKEVFDKFSRWFVGYDNDSLVKNIYDILVLAYEKHDSETTDYEYQALMDNICESIDTSHPNLPAKYKKGFNKLNWDIHTLTLFLYLLKYKPSAELCESIYTALDQVRFGWKDNETYSRRNTCMCNGHSCRDRQGVSSDSWNYLFNDLEVLFGKHSWGCIISSIFAYSVTSLFSSRLNFNEIRFPFPLHIACDRGSNILSLIQNVVSICDVNMPIPSNCQKNVQPRFFSNMLDNTAPAMYMLTGRFEYDLRELKRFRDIPSIVIAFGNSEEADMLIWQIMNQQPVGTHSLNGGLNTLPIFVSDAQGPPKSYGESIFIDLHNSDVPLEYLQLLETRRSLLGSWVNKLISDAPRDLLNPESSDDISPVYHCKALNRRLIDYRSQHNSAVLENDDFIAIMTLKFFLEQFLYCMGSSLREYEDTVFLFDGEEFVHSPDDLAYKSIASHIATYTSYFLANVLISQYADQTANIQIEDTNVDQDEAQRVQKKGKQYLKKILSTYQDYGVRLRAGRKAVYKNERYIFPVTLGQGTHISKVTANAAEVRMHLNLPCFYPSVTADSIKLIVSENDIAVCNLANLLEDSMFTESQAAIPYAVGINALGDPVVADVAEFPHLLIGGTTGSGKSSALHSLLTSIVLRQPSDRVKLLLLDFGSSSLSIFENTPHLLTHRHVISDPEEGYRYLMSLLMLMQEREDQLRQLNLQEQKKLKAKWPSVVCAIDELPALTGAVPEAADVITKLLERSRKQKIHMVFCTQDATQDRLRFKTNNIPSRIAFRCNSHHTSESILGASGAEKLTGKGAMYLKTSDDDPLFTYGAYMEPSEIQRRLDQHDFSVDGTYQELVLPNPDTVETQAGDKMAPDTTMVRMKPQPWRGLSQAESLLRDTILWIYKNELTTISANQIKKQFGKGQDAAKDCIDTLEKLGIVSPRQGQSKRPRSVDMKAVKSFLAENHVLSEDSDIHAEHSVTEV